MNDSNPPADQPASRGWVRNVVFLVGVSFLALGLVALFDRSVPSPAVTSEVIGEESGSDELLIARRLSLALTGSIPSLEEIRQIEGRPSGARIDWYLDQLLWDQRSAEYLAERFVRALVGTEVGPFVIYRRHRMKRWLADEFAQNHRWDDLARELIAAEGIWTSNPGVNFLTVAIDQNAPEEIDRKKPDPVKMATRTTRAFLGVRFDCVQCHDDKFGDQWKQEDFHELAAFFSDAEMSVTGMREKDRAYETRYKGERDAAVVPAQVPYGEAWLPDYGSQRERLAGWATHPENRPFARAAVNRIWAILFNEPLVTPIDDIPLEGPYPDELEPLTDFFIASDYDLRALIREIVSMEQFRQREFPITRLRPEQFAQSISQAAALHTVDQESPFIRRLVAWGESNDFVKRYGDLGEDEFGDQSETIPQRLLMMNGKLVAERTKENPILNASTRIGQLVKDDREAIETVYLSVMTRRPTEAEALHFADSLDGTRGKARLRKLEDLYWALFNSTEFSTNH